MTFPANPAERSPRGDHNRRLSLGIEIDDFASEAGITADELRAYEVTEVEESFDANVAERVGRTLERLELRDETHVDNGPSPGDVPLDARIEEALHRAPFVRQLSDSDALNAELLVAAQLATLDPGVRLMSFGERPRGPLREIVVGWQADTSAGETIIPSAPVRFEAHATLWPTKIVQPR